MAAGLVALALGTWLGGFAISAGLADPRMKIEIEVTALKRS